MLPEPESESDKLVGIIRSQAKFATAEELSIARKLAELRVPAGYDEHTRNVQQHYSGNQHEIIRLELKRRFPDTEAEFPISPVNWVKHMATVDAGVYQEEPERYLVSSATEKGAGDYVEPAAPVPVDDAADETTPPERPSAKKKPPSDGRLPKEHPQAQKFAWLVESAKLCAKMIEAEIRALIPCAVVVYVPWVKKPDAPPDDKGQPSLRFFWPHDIFAICHPSMPDDFNYAIVFGVRIASPDPASKADWFWVWSRDYVEDERGAVKSWGPWFEMRVSSEGDQERAAKPVQYKGTMLPFGILQIGEPQGYVFVDEERDVLANADNLNVERANEQFTRDLQGHTQGWVEGEVEESKIKIGPDKWPKLISGTLHTIDFDPKLVDMREGRKLTQRENAVARDQPADAYDTDPRSPESGAARMVSNIPHDNKVKRIAHVCKEFEECWLLRVLMDEYNAFAEPGFFTPDLKPVMQPRRAPPIEDPEAKQRRLVALRDAGLISDARVAVDLGIFGTVDEAVEAGLSDELGGGRNRSPSSSIADRFAMRLGQKPTEPTGQKPSEKPGQVPAKPDAAESADVGGGADLNELTLGIERLGRLGDEDTVNILRRALAEKLGVSYGGDIAVDDLAANKPPEP